MSSVHYTELAEQTYKRALERLEGKVSASLLIRLQKMLATGAIDDPGEILAAVREVAEQESDNVN
jgi:hypothetical protein